MRTTLAILFSILGTLTFHQQVLADTKVPYGYFDDETFPFDIVAEGEVDGHSGYALHYWNIGNLSAEKKIILYLSEYDYEDPFRNFLKSTGSWTEWWNDSWGNIYKARKANLIYQGHTSTAPNAAAASIPVAVFVARDTSQDIRKNAANLVAAIAKLNQFATDAGIGDANADGFPDYQLIVVANGIGGLWARAAFAQEQSNFGVDKLITVDTPHKGLLASSIITFQLPFLAAGSLAAQQMYNGDNDYNQFFSWLEGEENESFISTTIDPINTIAVAFSNGENPWDLLWGDGWAHNVYYGVSSVVDLAQIEALLQLYAADVDAFLTGLFGPDHGFEVTLGDNADETTMFVPYHSAIMANMPYNTSHDSDDSPAWITAQDTGFLQSLITYTTTSSRYFDTKVSLLKSDGSPQDHFHLNITAEGEAEKITFLWSLY